MGRATGRSSRSRAYKAVAFEYDGSNDYATRGAALTGLANGKVGTISLWHNLNGGDGSVQTIFRSNSNSFHLSRSGANAYQLVLRDTDNNIVMNAISTGTDHTAGASWRHVLFSWDLANDKSFIYIDDSDETDLTPAIVDTDVDQDDPDWGFGATEAGGNLSDACFSEFWYDPTFIDISVEANRRKFITPKGKPARLGTSGEFPTGSAPIIYAPDGDPSDNKGTGGNFTITGALTVCGTAP